MTAEEKEELRLRAIIHHYQQLERLIPDYNYESEIDYWEQVLEKHLKSKKWK